MIQICLYVYRQLDLLKFYKIVETNEGTFKDVGWGWAFVG